MSAEISALLTDVAKACVPVLTTGVLWVGKKLNGMDGRLGRVETILAGPDGKNGLRSKVEKIERQQQADSRHLLALRVKLGEDVT